MVPAVGEMRGVPLVLMGVAVLALLPLAFAMPGSPQPTEPPLVVHGSTACYATGQPCTFTVEVHDASLIFFRWDLDEDGTWDYPVGGGGWTDEIAVTVGPSSPYYDPAIPRVCAQGWDGVSTDDEGGVPVPRGPTSCSDPSVVIVGTLVVRPGQWSRHSTGRWVTAFFDLPDDVDAEGLVAGTVTLEGVPAVAVPRDGWRAGGNGTAEWVFKVDRVTLTERLGPGTHTVHLQGEFAEGTFAAVDDIRIL